MPYIKKDERVWSFSFEDDPHYTGPQDSGQLNYFITKLIMHYWKGKGPKYQHANDIVGALEGAKAEFQRRVLAKYEDKKKKLNGDVYN